MNEFCNKISKKTTSPVRKDWTKRETGKEGNPRRFPAACEMRKDRKACGRDLRDRNLSSFLSCLLLLAIFAGKLLKKKKTYLIKAFKNTFVLDEGHRHTDLLLSTR